MRAFAWFLGVILLAGLIGAVIAYPAYELSTRIADWQFHRVASRIAMLILLVELVWLCRRLALTRKQDFGYGLPWRRFAATALAFGAVGIATAGVGAAFLFATRLRIMDPAWPGTAGGFAHITAVALASGLAVALLEETVFRGAMHTAIERESGALAAVLLTAPLFAVLHFFAKLRIPAAEVSWSSGFYLLAHSFAPLGQPSLVLDAFLSWLMVGLILSMTRVLTGNIAAAIGLHAGWVVVLRLLQQSTVGGSAPAYSAWVSRVDGLLGFWLMPWGAGLAAALWLTRGAWVPRAGQGKANGASSSSR